jgi:hypothetical protein
MAPMGQMGEMDIKYIFDIGKIFRYGPRFLR